MPETPQETNVIHHEVRVAASRETVFSYFTDPAKLVEWMGAQATVDPRPGGVCRIVFHPLEADATAMTGSFVEVEPPNRLVLTWGWELEPLAVPPQSTSVEVDLRTEGDETVVRLTHSRLPAPSVDFHNAGWGHYLPRLVAVAGGLDPGHDPWQAEASARR
jgi:uncharacterized protein YndB with AHSA1/START domain